MMVEFSPIRDTDGRVIGAVQILRDVTDERRRQEAEAQARRFESVGQLAGGIAHDFNNIITGILAYASLLEHSLEAGDERRVDVKEIERSATRAAELTSQLLAYARRQVVEPRVVAVNAQVRETSRLLQRLIGEGIELSVDLAPDLWNVRIDPAQFEQVLVNLAINARDAMPEGGHLRLVTANATLTAMQLPQPASGPGEYVRIDVSDTGTGIPGDLLDRIFEPFFTTKAIGKGTGLGLASVFGTVQQAGGAIAVESDGEHGATFSVFLPRVLQDADATGASGDGHAVAGKGETILLVEDETAVLESIKRALERHGYRVLSATNGDDALAHMRDGAAEVRLVIADLVLPRSSGKTLIEQLRSDHPELRAILMSGYGEAAERVPGVRFLAKPFAPSEMTAAVRELLDS
jgi:two-component system cell cycle sensor histidine kinase/response regulator CckA